MFLDSLSLSFRSLLILFGQNNFNFEKRDWMTVKTDELPTGSKLVRVIFFHLPCGNFEVLRL